MPEQYHVYNSTVEKVASRVTALQPLGTEVGLGPGDTVRWGPSSPPKKGVQPPPQFSALVCCGIVGRQSSSGAQALT